MRTFVLLLLSTAAASAAIIKPGGWTATSTAAPTEERSFEPTNVGDGKVSTAWAEGDEGAGLGAAVTADLGAEKTLTGFTIWPGNFYNYEFWQHYNRPKTVTLEFSDGSTQDFTLVDEMKGQFFAFSSPKKTSTVKVKVKAIFAGKGVDTAISEVQFQDAASPSYVPVKSFAASSTFPADNEGDYNADNLEDGLSDSMWCEGNKTGDGTNEWVEFTFAGPTSVSKLKFRNGAGFSPTYFKQANRFENATLTFSDGSTEHITAKDMFFEQSITFPTHDTSKVRITFDSVKKGTDYNDLCLSEAYFLP